MKTVESSTTPYTPSSQKRFNPFLKDQLPLMDNSKSPAELKKPLTPTKEHPLQDLSEEITECHETDEKETNFVDEDDGYCDNGNDHHMQNEKVQSGEITDHDQNDENKNVILYTKEDEIIENTALSSNDSLNDGVGIVKSTLPPGKVVRRKKSANPTASTKSAPSHRASFPLAKTMLHKSVEKLEAQMHNLGSETDSSERLEHHDAPVPDWVVAGESVLIRPYNTSGVISFVGPTHFQVSVFFF